MVRQKILDISVKKMKMAQELMSVLLLMGITEEDIDELFSLVEEVKVLREKVAELEEFKNSVRLQQINSTKGGTLEKKPSIKEEIESYFGEKIEEFTPYGKK